jgi:hypothetical protein
MPKRDLLFDCPLKALKYVAGMCTMELAAQVEGLHETGGYSDVFPFVNSLFCECT